MKKSIIPISQIKKWIIALRSGEFIQSQGDLENINGYCCLGVACKLFIPKNKLKIGLKNPFLQGSDPYAQPSAPQWLKRIDDDFSTKTEISLVNLNDEGINGIVLSTIDFEKYEHDIYPNSQFTFDEIADMLDMVYVLKVLE